MAHGCRQVPSSRDTSNRALINDELLITYVVIEKARPRSHALLVDAEYATVHGSGIFDDPLECFPAILDSSRKWVLRCQPIVDRDHDGPAPDAHAGGDVQLGGPVSKDKASAIYGNRVIGGLSPVREKPTRSARM